MAKVTWKGEDFLHGNPETGGFGGPSYTTAFGIKFPKGEAVDVSDKDIVRRASRNQFFEVGDDDGGDTGKRGPGRSPKLKSDE